MSKGLFLLGLDPGLAHMGWAVVELQSVGERVLSCGVCETEQSNKKRKVLATDDNLRRAREMAAELDRIFSSCNIAAVCAESMSFPRSSSAAAKMAMCWGAVATFAHLRGLPVVQSSPQEIKKVLCGNRSASKDEVGEAVLRRYPAVRELLDKVANGDREHAYDAVAAVVASLDSSEVVRALRGVLT